jgi:hypothetical protein
MSSNPHADEPDKLHQEIREFIEKVRDLADELKIVQEHENAILENNDPIPNSHWIVDRFRIVLQAGRLALSSRA